MNAHAGRRETAGVWAAPARRRRSAPSARPRAFGRAVDILVSLALIIFFAPVLLAAAIAVRLSGPGPIFAGQTVIGLNQNMFRKLRFRTRAIDDGVSLSILLSRTGGAARVATAAGAPSADRIGPALRRSGLDRLPALFNVLAGDMSLVGPRPLLASEADAYGPDIEVYARVRPGIAGVFRLAGRRNAAIRRRARLDVLYVRRKGAAFDLWLIFRGLADGLFRPVD